MIHPIHKQTVTIEIGKDFVLIPRHLIAGLIDNLVRFLDENTIQLAEGNISRKPLAKIEFGDKIVQVPMKDLPSLISELADCLSMTHSFSIDLTE